MNKKAEIGSVFRMILIISVTMIILLFGTTAIVRMISSFKEAELADFANTLEENIQQAGARKGSKMYTYNIPDNVKSIVFLDNTNKKALLRNDFVKNDPIIKDIVETGEKKNMFLFSVSGKLLKTFYIGDVAIGQFGDEVCTGIGKVDITLSRLSLRISNKAGVGIILGEDCSGLKYMAFQGPFSSDMESIPHIEFSGNDKQIVLKKDKTKQAGEGGYDLAYFINATFNSTEFPLYGATPPERIFYSVTTPEDSDVVFRIGFRHRTYGDYYFYGENISAQSKMDEGYYYDFPGQYITEPSFAYDSVKVQVIMTAGSDLLTTPIFNWLKLSYETSNDDYVAPFCGDGECLYDETHENCPVDCAEPIV